MEVGPNNVVQIITDNAAVCKAASMLIEVEFTSIYWTPLQIADDATFIKKFIVGHSMRISMFNRFNSLKLLSVASTRFASTIVMLKRFKSLKKRTSKDGY